ncbi:MAG: anti-sigma factor family protein [Phormidesmis sp.]
MFNGDSNFQHSVPTAWTEHSSTETGSDQWISAGSANHLCSYPLESQTSATEQYSFGGSAGGLASSHSLVTKENDLSRSSSSGEKRDRYVAAYDNDACDSNTRQKNGESEGDTEPVVAAELLGTADEAFELLSAYLDDEVTAEERCLVQHWLASDPEMQSHYQKQLRLRQAMKLFMSDSL